MAGSLVQSVLMPALHGMGSQFFRPDKAFAVSRVTVSNLQLRSPSLRFSGTRVPLFTFFLGTESILRGRVRRPVRKQIRCVPAEAFFENFTEDIIKVIMLAQEESRRLGHNYVGSEQLLLGLLGKKHSLAAMYLGCLDLNLKDARVMVESITGRGSGFVEIAIPFTPHAKQILKQAREEARQLEHNYIGDEHLFLALLADGGGVAGTVLETIGVDTRKIHTELIDHMTGESTEVGDAVVWDESYKQRKSTSNLSDKLKSPPTRLDEQLNKISSAEGNERSCVAKDERDKTDLHVLLIEVLENCRMVAAQLEAQNKNLQLDRDQIKEQTNNLLGVLNKIADSLGKIADKL